uniref:Rad21_Rec8 domain-containing protein n=1 Tax=Haemonchus contortus TaxID=6289 RepID=A0A7I4YPK6_HAECO
MEDTAVLHAKDGRALRDATSAALAQVWRDARSQTSALAQRINEGPPPSPQPKETPSDLGDLEPDVFFEVADLESLVPAQELRELLLTPDLLASPAKSSSGIPVQAESLLEPKSEMSSAESIAAIPLPLGPPPPGSSGAVAPYVESFGASSPPRTASVVSASSLSARRDAVAPTNKLENLPFLFRKRHRQTASRRSRTSCNKPSTGADDDCLLFAASPPVD